MESIKGKFSELLKYLEDTIKPLTDQNFQFIESQRNVFYFSKFSIDPNEFYQIFSFIWSIKVTIFKKVLSLNKLTVATALIFPNLPLIQEKDKLLTLFSLCYLHYYSSFQYETNNSFEDYYNTNLAILINKYNIIIKEENTFKTFAYQFFVNMRFELEKRKDEYSKIKLLTKHYNPHIINEEKSENNSLHKTLLTQLVAAKEHIVEMVFENNIKKKYSSKAVQDDMNLMINNLSKVVRESYIREIANSNEQMSPKIQEQSENDSAIKMKDRTLYSKRLLSELIRCEVEPNMELLIKEISSKIDETMLDKMINQKTNCAINLIQCFICYNVEINSDIIKTIPEYQNIKEDITMKFIVPAKDIYNRFVEVYFSLYDLVYTDYNNLKYILDKQGLPAKFYNSAYVFGTSLANEMVISKRNVQENMNEVISNFVEKFIIEWERTIKENGKKLTHFCLI